MSLFKGLILTCLAYFLLIGAALADHMTGQYSGTGQVQGTNLVIQQSGRTVSGQFSGTTNGTLNRQSDGGENVTGTISLASGQQFQFQALHSQQGLQIRVSDGRGAKTTFSFAAQGRATPPRPGRSRLNRNQLLNHPQFLNRHQLLNRHSRRHYPRTLRNTLSASTASRLAPSPDSRFWLHWRRAKSA